MRNLLIFMVLVGVFVLGNRACNGSFLNFGGITGSGPIQTETRSVSDFKSIDLEISGDVEVTVGESYSVEVSAHQNLLPVIKTTVENGKLLIFADQNIYNSSDIKVKVTAPAFDGFSVSGSGTIRVVNALQGDKMDMRVGGAGDIVCLQGNFNQLNTSIGGSGTIELGGNATTMQSDISGSGDVKAKGLTAQNLEVSISGSGTVTADVETSLKISISGSGDVFYSGSPTVESSVSGSGTVKQISVQ